jgi:phosphodiesterase/alkaline phosphatase D-like protein
VSYTVLPQAPTITGEGATAVDASSATLEATVDPNGGAVSECRFEYGTTVDYGHTASCLPSPGSGEEPVAVAAAIAGLDPGTTYHFRVVAVNAGGTGEGVDESFTTLPNPPTLVLGTASSLTSSSAVVNATVNPNGGAVVSCVFEYGASTAYGYTTSCAPSPGSGTSPVPVSASLAGLGTNSTFHYRVVASNVGGESRSADGTFATLPNPPRVTVSTPEPISQTTATLRGTVNPEGGAVTECQFEYGSTTAYGHIATCSPLPGADTAPVSVAADVTSLSPNTTYHYRLVAANAGGTVGSPDHVLTTLPDPPATVTGSASLITPTSATLGASVNPNGGLVTDCRIEYGLTTAYGQSATCSPAPGSGTTDVAVSATLSGLTPNTGYHYRVVATNAGGVAQGLDRTFTTLPPGPPSVATTEATLVVRASATLNGTVNPEGANVTECLFEYGSTISYGQTAACSPAPGSGSTPISVAANVAGLRPGTLYHFRLVATNAAGTRRGADLTFVTATMSPPSVVTDAATSVRASVATLAGTVNPNEEAVSDCHFDYGTSTHYGATVACAPSPGAGGIPVAVSSKLVGLSPNTTYHFRLAATNGDGTSYGLDQTLTTLSIQELEVGVCAQLAQPVGRYHDSGCLEPSAGESTGPYEWHPWPLSNSHFNFKSGSAKLESVSRATLTCRNNTLSGDYTSADTASATLVFTGCEGTRGISGSCSSEGAASGELKTPALRDQLGVLPGGSIATPGWSIGPASDAADLIDAKCGTTNVRVAGSAIAQISVGTGASAVGKMYPSYIVKFATSKGRQKVEALEGGLPQGLELITGSHGEQAGLKMKSVLAVGEPFEIRPAG